MENPIDRTTTVDDLKLIVRQFVDERHWQTFHNPKNLTMSLAIEVGELMEHFQWLTLDESAEVTNDEATKRDVEEELSDCLAYILAIANAMQIDLSSSLAAKMRKNRRKYPAPDPGE